jgi:DNA helicase II / ATP-dependent DNA helicase PcrA
VSLNEFQLAAVNHRQGPANILAGPGAGKTATVARLVAALFREGENPSTVLCQTFSNDAAAEMRHRISSLTRHSEETLKKTVATFHSLAFRIIREEQSRLGFTLADSPVIREAQIRRALRQFVSKDSLPRHRAYIARQRRMLITPEAAMLAAENGDLGLAEVYGMYDDWLKEEGKIDFDSMVYRAVGLVEHGEWAGRFHFVIVDECHDTSFDQNTLAEFLAAPRENLTRVFDPSQQIYQWRGADCSALLDPHSPARRYFLPINYRSHSEIIEAFTPFAEQDALSQELVRKMRSARGPGGSVTVKEFMDETDQARAVCEEIGGQGLAPENSAVLARTRALLLPYCELLEQAGVPFYWNRGKNFWKSAEIEEAVAFCRLAVDPSDARALARACGSSALCAKYLTRTFGEAVVRAARAAQTSPLKIADPEGPWKDYQFRQWREMRDAIASLVLMRKSRPDDFLCNMRITTGFAVADAQGDEEPDNFARENLDALVRRAAKFDSLLEFVRHAERMANMPPNRKGVALSTIHSAKGLEFESVYVIGVTHKIIPHVRSDNFDEERRLMYVALSRAKRALWVSSHGERSVFISYIPEKFREPTLQIAKPDLRISKSVGVEA